MEPDLTALGLSPNESALYLLLLDRQSAAPEDLAEEWGPGRGTVDALLRSLTAKGVVTTMAGPPVRHAAIAPDVALDNLARVRTQEIAAACTHMDELTNRWHRAGRATIPAELVEIVVGREATLQRSELIQRSATEEVLIIDAPPYANAEGWNPLEADLLASGSVRYRCLYARPSLEIPGKFPSIMHMVETGEEARVAAGLPLKMIMGDQSVAMLPLDSAPASITASVIVHPSALLSSLGLMFEALWRSAAPLRHDQGPDAHRADGAITEADRDLVLLLVAGMTDESIGRQLGLAGRTIQRRVQTIMRNLGVDNRLQLGIRLAQQGWGTDDRAR